MILLSPAKINLFLQIRGKREDGLHELESLMQAIDLGDEFIFELAKVDSLEISGADLANDRSNLIWRAIDLFRQETGCNEPVSIHLEKRIPMEAGLGGGSSNAATALFAINELCGRPASSNELQQMGALVGSDVPFFFSSGTALCTGTGTDVLSLDPLPRRAVHLIKPELSLSTKAVYSRFERVGELLPPIASKTQTQGDLDGAYLAMSSEAEAFMALQRARRRRGAVEVSPGEEFLTQSGVLDAGEWAARFAAGDLPLRNDLEEAAFSLAPGLEKLYADLAQDGPVVLAGSGSTLVSFASLIDRGVRAHFLNREADGWY